MIVIEETLMVVGFSYFGNANNPPNAWAKANISPAAALGNAPNVNAV